MRIKFSAMDDRGSADAGYGVLDLDRPAGDRVIGQVVRYGTEWVATDPNSSWVSTRSRRGDAAADLAVAAAPPVPPIQRLCWDHRVMVRPGRAYLLASGADCDYGPHPDRPVTLADYEA